MITKEKWEKEKSRIWMEAFKLSGRGNSTSYDFDYTNHALNADEITKEWEERFPCPSNHPVSD